MNPRIWIFLGCVWAAIGVVLGAFGAHALEETLAASGKLETWETGVRYQLFHALALIAFGVFRERAPGKDFPAPFLFLGSALFSLSIYALCFDFMKGVMGPLTPLGGLLMIVGWLGFAREALRRR